MTCANSKSSSGCSCWEFCFAVNQRSQIPADVTETPSLHDTTHNGTKCGCDPALVCLCWGFTFPEDRGNKTKNQKYFLWIIPRSTNASIPRISLSQETRPSRRRVGFDVALCYSNVDLDHISDNPAICGLLSGKCKQIIRIISEGKWTAFGARATRRRMTRAAFGV